MFRATFERVENVWLVLLLIIAPAALTRADEPKWIWGSAKANESAPDGLVLFKKNFELSAPPKSALLRITCDDQYVVRVNGRLVGVNEHWQDIERFEIANVLQTGTNSIFVRSRNLSEGPAGMMFDLEMTRENGDKVNVVSDDTWEASIQKSGTWNPDIAKIKKWKPVTVLGTLSQASPWKDQLSETDSARVIGRPKQTRDKFELLDGDRVLLLGNTVIEREQRYGYWEAALTTRYPDRKIIFRNLGWSGDTVLGEARARFGTQPEGFAHLEVHVHAVNPTVIICGYGSNAAFEGADGLDAFIANYNNLLDAIETTGAAITLMAPLRHEPFQGKYLTPDYNANRDLYANAIKHLAKARDCLFFELPQHDDDKLTDNGVHLTEEGYAVTASRLEEALGLEKRTPTITHDLAKLGAVTGAGKKKADNEIGFTFKAELAPKRLATPLPDSVEGPRDQVQVKGLAEEGKYRVTFDGKSIDRVETAKSLSKGVQLPTPNRAHKRLDAIRRKNELYFHRWRPQNETYLFLFRKHEQGNNAVEIPQFDELVEDVEKEIDQLKTPKRITVLVEQK